MKPRSYIMKVVMKVCGGTWNAQWQRTIQSLLEKAMMCLSSQKLLMPSGLVSISLFKMHFIAYTFSLALWRTSLT